MVRILILAVGNPLRGDDGVAWQAAEELGAKFSAPEVEVTCAHQLAPEMAEKISWVDAVIFLDAAEEGQPGEVRCKMLGESCAEVHFCHQLSPEAILALAKQLYGASPLAYSVTVTGQRFDHEDALSSGAAEALASMVAKVDALIHELLTQTVLSGSNPT